MDDKINKTVTYPVADPRGRHGRGPPPQPLGPFFFVNMLVLEENRPKYYAAPSPYLECWRPSSGKFWIRQCCVFVCLGINTPLNQYIQNIVNIKLSFSKYKCIFTFIHTDIYPQCDKSLIVSASVFQWNFAEKLNFLNKSKVIFSRG